jgi:CubicO group peptidase (beta-lactamase class C family)
MQTTFDWRSRFSLVLLTLSGPLAAGCSPSETVAPDPSALGSAASALTALKQPVGAPLQLGALPLRYGPLEPLLPEALRAPRPLAEARSLRVLPPEVPERFQAFVAAVEQDRLAQGIPGLAVAIVEGGRVTFARGFGSKGPDNADPVQPTTLFRIASCTKQLTAIPILRGVERGDLDLDAPLVSYLPSFTLARTPEPVPQITLRQLLSHSSGLGDYLEVDVSAEEKVDSALQAFLLGRYRDIGYVMAPPGAVFSYSNAGFSLLGLVAETLRQMPYRKLMRDEVFAPLQMNRSYFLPSEVLQDGDFALGGCPADQPECGGFEIGPVIAPDGYDNAWDRPPAGAWSSVLDLAKFTRFLLHGDPQVLSDGLRAEMASPQISTHFAGNELAYGLGLEIATGFELADDSTQAPAFYPSKTIFHDGAMPGFRSMIECVPDADFCWIALTNFNTVSFSEMGQAALRLMPLPPADTSPSPVLPHPERFAEYAGTYFDPFAEGELRITLDAAGNLELDDPLYEAFEIPYEPALVPNLVDTFVIFRGGSPDLLTFLAGPSGSYDYLRVGDRTLATRVSGAPAAPSAAPELAPGGGAF